jgi:hypothetical protein
MTIAYFSMEMGLATAIRTYSGGLGIAVNGSFFTAQRMLTQYPRGAYFSSGFFGRGWD